MFALGGQLKLKDIIFIVFKVYRKFVHGPNTMVIINKINNSLLISVLRSTVSPAFKLYGSLIRVWVLMFPFFAILKPEDLQVVLSSRKHTEKIFFYKLLHNFLGNGLITSSGELNEPFNRLDQLLIVRIFY